MQIHTDTNVHMQIQTDTNGHAKTRSDTHGCTLTTTVNKEIHIQTRLLAVHLSPNMTLDFSLSKDQAEQNPSLVHWVTA